MSRRVSVYYLKKRGRGYVWTSRLLRRGVRVYYTYIRINRRVRRVLIQYSYLRTLRTRFRIVKIGRFWVFLNILKVKRVRVYYVGRRGWRYVLQAKKSSYRRIYIQVARNRAKLVYVTRRTYSLLLRSYVSIRIGRIRTVWTLRRARIVTLYRYIRNRFTRISIRYNARTMRRIRI